MSVAKAQVHPRRHDMVSVGAAVHGFDIFPARIELVQLVLMKLCSVAHVLVVSMPLLLIINTHGLFELVGSSVVVGKAAVSSLLIDISFCGV